VRRLFLRMVLWDWDRGLVPLARRGWFGLRPSPKPPEAIEEDLAASIGSITLAAHLIGVVWFAVVPMTIGSYALAVYGHGVSWSDAEWDVAIVRYYVAWGLFFMGLCVAVFVHLRRSLEQGGRATEGLVGVERQGGPERSWWAAEFAARELPYLRMLAERSAIMQDLVRGPGAEAP
jgi:hypothetical protein